MIDWILGRRKARLRVDLGTVQPQPPIWPPHAYLDERALNQHLFLVGTTRQGKSKLAEHLFYSLHRQGQAASLVDPHSDSANSLLNRFVAERYFEMPGAYDRLWWVQFSDREGEEHFPAFNILQLKGVARHQISENILSAFHRVFPSLESGSPRFDNIMLAGADALLANDKPILGMARLLVDKGWRNNLLQSADPETISFFHDRFDAWQAFDRANYVESTLNKIFYLSHNPCLKYALSTDGCLGFRRILDEGISVIWDVGGIGNEYTRALVSAMIALQYETAAKERKAPGLPRTAHRLFLDEFASYSNTSGKSIEAMLTECGKFGLWVAPICQTVAQLGERTQAAVQNCGIRVAFRIGPEDARVLAPWFGEVDPLATKDLGNGRTGSFELAGQWQLMVNALQRLVPQHMVVKVGDRAATEVVVPTVPSQPADPDALEAVKAEYRRRLTMKRDEIDLSYMTEAPPAPPLGYTGRAFK